MFRGCTSLTSITIPESVTKIGERAFYGCTSLTSITIPESVTKIGESAFEGCTSLSITIPDGVTKIGERAFYGCKKIVLRGTAFEPNKFNFNDDKVASMIAGKKYNVKKMSDVLAWYNLSGEEDAGAYIKKKAAEFLKCLLDSGKKADFKAMEKFMDDGLVSAAAMDKTVIYDYVRNLKKKKKKMPIFQDWILDGQNEKAVELLKKSCKNTIHTLIDNDDIDSLCKIRDIDGCYTKKNIDGFITYARENDKNEIMMMFMNYKNEHF